MATATQHRELTDRQREIYEFLVSRQQLVSTASVRQIGERFGIRSPNGVVCHLRALEEKGFIRREPGEHKGITILGDDCPMRLLNKLCSEVAGNPSLPDEIWDIAQKAHELLQRMETKNGGTR